MSDELCAAARALRQAAVDCCEALALLCYTYRKLDLDEGEVEG